jgi:cytochrome c556
MRFALVALPLLALTACGAPDTPGQRAAHLRHANFEQIGDAFKDVSEDLKDQAPDVAQLRVDAATIFALAPRLQSWFPKGSGPQDKVRTQARAEVWTKPAEFQHEAERFTAAATTFDAAAKAGDVAAMRAAAKELGGACKACHERFREKD